MIVSNKDTQHLIYFEEKKFGKTKLTFVRNSNEICNVSLLKINDTPINLLELGQSVDIEPQKAPPTGCGKRVFIPNYNVSDTMIKRLNTNNEDMIKILKYLEENLKIGCCKICT